MIGSGLKARNMGFGKERPFRCVSERVPEKEKPAPS